MDSPYHVLVLLVLVLALGVVGEPLLFRRSCCSRINTNQSAAAATLKSGIFPAQVQFQAAAYRDQDGDGVGEYGLLSELSGRRAVGTQPAGAIRFLQGPLAKGEIASGYHYVLHLPDGAGGALGEPAGISVRPEAPDAAAQAQERRFRAYAWPATADGGKQMFCIDESGMLRAQPWTGKAPSWDSVSGGKGWDAPAVWPVFSR